MFNTLLASALMIGNFGTASAQMVTAPPQPRHIEWPSRRTIRASVRQSGNDIRGRGLMTIQDIALDGTFTDTDASVKIQYPTSWERQDLQQHSDPLTLVVMFLSKEFSAPDLRQNINLVVEDLTSPLALDEYTKLGIAMEGNYFDSYALQSSDDIRVAGVYAAHRVIFTASLTSGDMTFEQIWMVRGKKAHVWTFADTSSAFPEHVKTFERMMDTLTVQ